MDLVLAMRRVSPLAARLALDQVQTLRGALAIRAAERAGLARPGVLRAADKRVAELRGEDAPAPERLVVQAEAAETARIAWEAARSPQTRIVEAVGRGRWTGRL